MAYDPKIDYSDAIAKETNPAKKEALEQSRAEKIADASSSQLNDWNINRAGQSTSSPAPANGPTSLDKGAMTALSQQGSGGSTMNNVTVTDSNGNSSHVDGFILDGHTYVKNSDGTGTRLIDYDGSGGMYPGGSQTWNGTDSGQYTGSTQISIPGQSPAPSYPTYYPPYSPPTPSFISFKEPAPVINEDLQKITKYSYFFGIDKLTLMKNNPNNNCCFVSQDVRIGSLEDEEHIQLEADVFLNGGSVEFYIVDNGKEIPILPVGTAEVSNEKIFYSIRPRFSIDTQKATTIKRNGIVADVTLDKAMQSNDALYTIDYSPINAYDCKPISETIKVKVVIRRYDNVSDAPYVTKLKIRKFGGAVLWKQNI